MTKRRCTVNKIKIALAECGGRVSDAAQKLGCDAHALRSRIEGSPDLQKILEHIREDQVDLAESRLMERIDKGELSAITFFLKCQGRRRGWVEKQLTDQAVNQCVDIRIVPDAP